MDFNIAYGVRCACVDTFTPNLIKDLKNSNLYDAFIKDIEQAKNHKEAYQITIEYINKCM